MPGIFAARRLLAAFGGGPHQCARLSLPSKRARASAMAARFLRAHEPNSLTERPISLMNHLSCDPD